MRMEANKKRVPCIARRIRVPERIFGLIAKSDKAVPHAHIGWYPDTGPEMNANVEFEAYNCNICRLLLSLIDFAFQPWSETILFYTLSNQK